MPADLPAVVITRPRGQAAALADAVSALGREAVLLPLLEIDALADTTALRAALSELDTYAVVAFVSPNAIDAAFAHLDAAAWPPQVALAVLGEGSRASLAAHGIDGRRATIYCPPDGGRSDSEALMAVLATKFGRAGLARKRVLIVRGESGRELMAEALREAGADVTTVAAYRRRVPALDEAMAKQLAVLLERSCDWIITSSEALRGLYALVAAWGGEAAVAKLQQQHLLVPHARIAETAQSLGATRLTLTASGDASLLAALQSRA